MQALKAENDCLKQRLANSDRDRALDQARINSLSRQIQSLQTSVHTDDEPSQQLVQRQIDELNRQLQQDGGSLLLSKQNPAPLPKPRPQVSFESPRRSLEYQKAMDNISSTISYLRSSITAKEDIDQLRREIIRSSVKRKQEELALGASQRRSATWK